MKIICISDTHGREPDVFIEKCDVLIHSGDVDAKSLKDVVRLDKWFGNLDVKHKFFIPGNHDFFFESHMLLCKDTMQNAIVLNNEQAVVDGIKFWGSPITPEFFNWAFMAKRGDEIKRYWDLIPNDTDVLITHGPPFKILDKVRYQNVGCTELLKAVKRIRPKVHMFGHIHEGYGTKEIVWKKEDTHIDPYSMENKTLFINSSQLDGDYDHVNKPITIEI